MNDFFKTKEGKSSIKLFFWVIFIVLIIIFVSLGDSKTKVKEEIQEETYKFKHYDEMIDELLTGSFIYKYEVNSGESSYTLSGIKCDNLSVGFKEELDTITKYKNINEVVNIDDLFYLDLNNYFEYLKNYMYNVTKDEDKRIVYYNNNNTIITTDLSDILSITINDADTTYTLNFTKISKCANIIKVQNEEIYE